MVMGGEKMKDQVFVPDAPDLDKFPLDRQCTEAEVHLPLGHPLADRK